MLAAICCIAVNLSSQLGGSQSRVRCVYRYRELGDLDLPIVKSQPVNAGVLHDFQFINVEDYQGQGEFSPSPYFYQNLGEAEYVVALFVSRIGRLL